MEYNRLYSLIKFLIENYLFSDMLGSAVPIYAKAFKNQFGHNHYVLIEAIQ